MKSVYIKDLDTGYIESYFSGTNIVKSGLAISYYGSPPKIPFITCVDNTKLATVAPFTYLDSSSIGPFSKDASFYSGTYTISPSYNLNSLTGFSIDLISSTISTSNMGSTNPLTPDVCLIKV